MDRALQTYYENRFAMFASQGWKDMVADVQRMIDATNKLDGVTQDNLKFKQGELSIMRWIVSQEQIFEESYKGLIDESNA